ncbi:hypothetical protein [Shewanella sp.]
MLRPSPQGRVDGVTRDVSPMAEFALLFIAIFIPAFQSHNGKSV